MKRSLPLLKFLVVLSSMGGVLLSLIYAQQDGYTHWGKRLLYFTAQSNIWIGITFLLLLFPIKKKNAHLRLDGLYLLKYIFTVSITMTGIIFCGLLAPFAGADYTPWRLCNVLTHVVTPILAIADLFLDGRAIPLDGRRIYLTLLPFVFYLLLASVLGVVGVDFGRGEPYPYFFLNHNSPAGIFGFSSVHPFYLGSFYWSVLFSGMVLGIAFVYKTILLRKKKRQTV